MRRHYVFDGEEYQPIPIYVRTKEAAETHVRSMEAMNAASAPPRKDRRWLAVLIIGLILMCLSGSVIAAMAMA